ncbi:hypothetical protein CRG98_044541 [Punica granatum]|uniref:Uncharacterized protein n=1 Tax=Punica granatum TaxID=22663 RepID=A0A2I0HTN3_PUNGR|nr:hypothetical protein CRG98_044541 [Punica granatum]
MRCKKVNSHGSADPARLQSARARWLGKLAVQEVNSHKLADLTSFHGARLRWLGEHAVQESKLARVSRPGQVAKRTSEVARQTCGAGKRHEQGCSANLRCTNLNSHMLADPARLQEARTRWLGELRCRKVNWHGLADSAWLQEARTRWLGELRCRKVNWHGLADSAWLQEARTRWLGELRCRKVNWHGLADSAWLQEARTRWLGELRCRKVNWHGLADSAWLQEARTRWLGELRCRKVNWHGLADSAWLQEARTRWLGELAVQESKLAWLTRQGCKRHEPGGSANLRCRKVNSHGLADPASLRGAREWWLNELEVQESKLAWVSRPGKVEIGMRELVRRTCGAGKGEQTRQGYDRHEGGGSANLRCRKVNSHGSADPARLQGARARWFGELAVQEDPARLQEGRARLLGKLAVQEIKVARVSRPSMVARGTSEVFGELAVQESKLARVSRPGKVARGTSEVVRRTCGAGWHERGGSASLRCKKVNSHGLVDPARLQEARARLLGELAVQEIKLARVSRPSKVARGTSEVVRRTCGAGK